MVDRPIIFSAPLVQALIGGPDDDLYGTIYAAMIDAAPDPFKEPTV